MRLEVMPQSGRVRCGLCGVLLNVPRPGVPETVSAPAEPTPTPAPLGSSTPGIVAADFAEDLVDFGVPEPAPSSSRLENPHASPLAKADQDSLDESIDFVPYPAENAPLPRRVALSLSDGQLRDILAAASTTRSSVDFLAWILFISLAIQGLIIVVSVIAMFKSQSRGGDVTALVSVAMCFAAAIMTGVSAVLLKDYGSRLAEFLHSKQAAELVESLGVASRYWLTTMVMMILTLVLAGLALMAMFFFRP